MVFDHDQKIFALLKEAVHILRRCLDFLDLGNFRDPKILQCSEIMCVEREVGKGKEVMGWQEKTLRPSAEHAVFRISRLRLQQLRAQLSMAGLPALPQSGITRAHLRS